MSSISSRPPGDQGPQKAGFFKRTMDMFKGKTKSGAKKMAEGEKHGQIREKQLTGKKDVKASKGIRATPPKKESEVIYTTSRRVLPKPPSGQRAVEPHPPAYPRPVRAPAETETTARVLKKPVPPKARSEIEDTIKSAHTERYSDPKVENAFRHLDEIIQKAKVSGENRLGFLQKITNAVNIKNLTDDQKQQLTKLIVLRHDRLATSLDGYNTGFLELSPEKMLDRCNEMWALRMATTRLGTKNLLDHFSSVKDIIKKEPQAILEQAYRKAKEEIIDRKPVKLQDVSEYTLDKKGFALKAIKEFESSQKTFDDEIDSLDRLFDKTGDLKPEVQSSINQAVRKANRANNGNLQASDVMEEIISRRAALQACGNAGKKVAKLVEDLNKALISATPEEIAKKAALGLEKIINSDEYKDYLREISKYTVNASREKAFPKEVDEFLSQAGKGKTEEMMGGEMVERDFKLSENLGLKSSKLSDYLILPIQRGPRFELLVKEFSKNTETPKGYRLDEELIRSTSERNRLTNEILALRDAA